jgi:ATP/maltotriose-dependent transcriptional regulator MalT
MNQITNLEVVDLTTVCSTFPEKLEKEVPRDNMISTLLGQLKTNTGIIVVEGEEGLGKSTLLAQFARAHSQQTFSAFVTDSSRYAWDPAMLAQNLHEQIQFALGNMQFKKQPESDILSILRKDVAELQKKANWEKRPYYFIVDGLEEIPAEENPVIQEIIDLLPLGLATFRFLLSGSAEQLAAFKRGRVTMNP